eukprot:scaffold112375_cov69-Phaeocystis_antarctica.AAC.8
MSSASSSSTRVNRMFGLRCGGAIQAMAKRVPAEIRARMQRCIIIYGTNGFFNRRAVLNSI